MVSNPLPIETVVKLLQPQKALSRKVFTLLEMLIILRLLQFLKELSPIYSTPLPIENESKLLHPSNAELCMVFKPLPTFTEVRFVHPLNPTTDSTSSPIVSETSDSLQLNQLPLADLQWYSQDAILLHPLNALSRTLSNPHPITILLKLTQFSKALVLIVFKPFPILSEVRPLQPEKAEEPMLVTLSGMVMEARPLQPLKA